MPKPLFLDEKDAVVIHKATLHVLENTGIYLDHEEAEAIFLNAGAKKDDFGRILLPTGMVEDALEKSAARLRLWDRDGNGSILLRNGRTYFGPGSDALYNLDRQTGEVRRSTLSDIRDNVRVADALSGFDFVMSMALPEEVPPNKLYATVFAEMVKNTTKPLIVTATCLEDIKHIHKIAVIVSGDETSFRKKPFFIAYLEPISPLKLDRSIAERLLYCAENGIPIVFAAGANCGSGAPITPEGGVVQGGAESLAGLVLALLKNEEVKFIYGANTSVMDMRSSIVSYGAPEWFRTVAMYADMGKYYELPSWGTAGCSDSFFIDAQAAMEAYEGILMALQSGTTLAHDVGYLAHGMLYDARMLVLTDEMMKRARFLLKPVDFSEKSLATDVIDDIARKNEMYLAHPHTREVFRDVLWLAPPYINRKSIMNPDANSDLGALLMERVHGILAAHKPEKLPSDKVTAIDRHLKSIK